jgi:hypothetical protein
MILVYILAAVLMLILSPIVALTHCVEKWLRRRSSY